MEEKTVTIQELSQKSGYPIRTIRYYIQEGLLEPPPGRGRGGVYYDSHLQRLLEIKSLQNKGLKLSSIEEILLKGGRPQIVKDRDMWVRYEIKPGMELHLKSDIENRHGKTVSEIIRVARSLLSEGGTQDE